MWRSRVKSCLCLLVPDLLGNGVIANVVYSVSALPKLFSLQMLQCAPSESTSGVVVVYYEMSCAPFPG